MRKNTQYKFLTRIRKKHQELESNKKYQEGKEQRHHKAIITTMGK